MFIRIDTASVALGGLLGSSLNYGKADCDISSFVPSFPANQTQLVVPTNETAHFLGVAFGVQNYTCSSTNTYTSVGAVAEIIDFSCNTSDANFATIQNDIYAAWDAVPASETIQDVIASVLAENPPRNLGQHYFVTNPVTGSGVSPKWDFTASGENKGNADAYVVGKSIGNLASPDNSTTDVAWLELENVEGELADTIFRYDTVNGQPPASCTYGEDSDISIKYSAKYLFYGGSL
ncbi:hypothetical protein C8Q72DRAFT_826791 [Fomitopsis betulina]|nr:hypothetical protein C8Q72DRAFT_826791 [Fomitopsis betulina]